ncbi:pseudouridylate synthase [Litoribacter ruber]|uniref:pseudouridine synthase n=1 Tax=Litoribacter ruber TaxID=702568 RepID=UPI001BDAFED0|nr:pseudouridine synthase [Litoribacter ruber]MBT0810206.1 pseudouridylate synthase [Litoribacter ruber]
MLEILFQDEHYIIINKPAGMLVHRTKLAKHDVAEFAMQLLRDQLGQWVYPLHRIDRPTSGVLIFAKSSEAASAFETQFSEKKIKKYYLALVRGFFTEEKVYLDYPLKKEESQEMQEAQTTFWKMAHFEVPLPSSPKHPTSRYSLVKAFPHTGRTHQIRRHLGHLRNYIVGDTSHGDNKQNKFFRSQFDLHKLMLHAWQVEFFHPFTEELIKAEAPLPEYFADILEKLRNPELLELPCD